MIQGHRGSWCIKRTGKSFPAVDFLWEGNPPRRIPCSVVFSDFVYMACRVTIGRGSASPTSLAGQSSRLMFIAIQIDPLVLKPLITVITAIIPFPSRMKCDACLTVHPVGIS